MINLIAEVAGDMATQADDWAQWAYPLTAMVAIRVASDAQPRRGFLRFEPVVFPRRKPRPFRRRP